MYLQMTVSSIKAYHQDSKGFSLIELMACIAVIGIVFITLFRLQSQSVALSDAVEFKCISGYLAQQVLSDQDQFYSSTLTREGNFEESNQAYSWSCSSMPCTMIDQEIISKEASEKFKRMTVTISKTGYNYSITSWRYQNETDSENNH